MVFIDAGVPYHQQDQDTWCGAAAAQMVLDALGIPLCGQAELIHELYDRRLCGTTPSALQRALNRRLPPAVAPFEAHCDSDKARAMQRIANALWAGQGGASAMVHSNAHWVVVTAAAVGGKAVTGRPGRVEGFFINDPEPQTATLAYPRQNIQPPPLDHQLGDHCGAGDIFGGANTYVTRYEWERSYWAQPNTVLGQQGYFSVSNGARTVSPPKPATLTPPGPLPQTDDEIRLVVEAGIRRHRLDRGGPLAARIAGHQLGGVDPIEEPTGLVHQVRLMRGGQQVGTASVEQITGQFLGIQAPPSILLAPVMLQGFVQRALAQHIATMSDILNPAVLAEGRFTVHPTYVWQPCRESMSRYYPFARVDVGGTVVYVGTDGRVHRQLTSHDCA